MFFKKSLLAVAFLNVFLLVACDVKIGEKPPEPAEVGLGVTKCLSKSVDDLRLFFTAEVNDRDLAAAWTCVEAAFFQFDKYVVGQDRNRYTSQEIVNFLQKNFFENQNRSEITPALQKELMKLKQIFVGGSADFVTRDELKKSQSFIRNISQMTVELNPYMRIIIMNWVPNLNQGQTEDLAFFEVSNLAAQTFIKKLALIIKGNASEYRISDALKLVKEVESFFGEDWAWVDELQDLLPVVQKLKKSLAGGQEDLINNLEWPPVLTLGVRGYYQYLRYSYFIKTAHETGGGVRLVFIARTMEDIFSTFQELLVEKEGGAIAQNELFEILKAFEQVWPDLKVSNALLDEVMKIKQVLIGGDSKEFTAGDFENARLKVPELKRIVENFLTYYSVYSFEWDPESDGVDRSRKLFDEARNHLYKVGQDISHFLQGSYSFEDLLRLVDEVEKLYPSNRFRTYSSRKVLSDNSSMETLANGLRKYEPFVKEANRVLFGRNDTTIEEKNWVVVLPMVVRFYSIYQYFDYFIVDKNLDESQPLKDLSVLLDHSFVLIEEALGLKSEKYFTDDELSSLIIAAVKAEFLPKNLSKKTIQDAIQAIVQNILFDPIRRLNGEVNRFFSSEQIKILKVEFKSWLETQLVLNRLFNDDSNLSFSPEELINKISSEKAKVKDNDGLLQGLNEVEAVLDSKISHTLDSESQLQISNLHSWVYYKNAVFQLNMNRLLTRILLRSFSTEVGFARLTECDAKTGFSLLIGIFRDLDIFNPSDAFIGARFLEANIFMPRGDGDSYLNYFEMTELIGVIFSGLNVNDKLEKSLRNVCPAYKDKNGYEFTTYKCLSEHHYVAVRKYMTQLPGFKSFVDKLALKDKPPKDGNEFNVTANGSGYAEWNIIFRSAFKATGWKSNDGYGSVNQESVYISDMIFYPFIVHYLEYIYARFDSTKNGALQDFEARKAFPIFRPLLKSLAQDQINSGIIKESDLLAVFTYILKYKEQPSLGSIFQWLRWKRQESWDLWVTRSEMSQILGYIADQVSNSGESSMKNTLSCEQR